MFSGEVTHTNFIVFGLTRSGSNPLSVQHVDNIKEQNDDKMKHKRTSVQHGDKIKQRSYNKAYDITAAGRVFQVSQHLL